jgi:hypothetical protein
MLADYWPGAASVNACIKNEAETADEAVLLAVHQPAVLRTRKAGTNIEAVATEEQLLDAFLTDNVPSGYVLTPVTGPSGYGKSHVIRWLDAQLRRSPARDRLHIIRIPKSASLRKVVQLILEPLAKDPRYAKPRADLTRAVTEIDTRGAVVLFRAQLEVALAARYSELDAEFREHRDRGPQLRPLMAHARDLPLLFSDAALAEHFADTVLARVVARALDGRPDDAPDDDVLPQFRADDLLLPQEVNVTEAAKTVREYYASQIAVSDISRRQVAVDLLNSVVDTAIGNVFQLQQSTGGMTLQDIILGVRDILFEDGMDLVLLIDDFAALAGIQETLLKVCIYEGEYEGKKVRATMRTALALTDGYLPSRDTIMTRAQQVWVVGDRNQSVDEIKAGVVEMVGSYLNAARWGPVGLRREFDDAVTAVNSKDWLPVWRDPDLSDEDQRRLDAFGVTRAGHPLFPFNRAALEQLGQKHLLDGARLAFNPRRIINEIVRDTLLMRPTFASGAFPPPNFQAVTPGGFVANWVAGTAAPDAVKGRLNAALAVWGANPRTEAELGHLPPALFEAFSLPSLSDLSAIEFEPDLTGSDQTGAGPEPDGKKAPEPIPELEVEDPFYADWSRKLDAWAGGVMLVQEDARYIRNLLAPLVREAMDWPAIRLRRREIKASSLSIANARGNLPGGQQIIVCTDHKDTSGAIRAALLGAIRFTQSGSSWAYAEADQDYVASAGLIDNLRVQATEIFIKEAAAEAAVLGRALITQARVAGLDPPLRLAGAEGPLRGLFDPLPVDSRASLDPTWDEVRTLVLSPIDRADPRQLLQSALLDISASFQGTTGGKPFAVDAARLVEALGADIPAGTPPPDTLPEAIRAYVISIGDGRLWPRLQPLIARLREVQTQLEAFIDGKLDKADFVADLREVVRLLSTTGLWPRESTLRVAEIEVQLNEFQASAVADLVSRTGIAVSETGRDDTPKLLNALGAMDLGLIRRMMSFFTTVEELITATEPGAVKLEASRAQADPQASADEITELLQVLATTGDEA